MRARFVMLGAVLTLGLAACGGSGGSKDHTSAAPKAAADSAGIKVSQSSLGPILTDQNGRTLYGFANDKQGTSSCTKECIATWPGLVSRGPVAVGQGVQQGLLKKIQRAEGTEQAVYGAWPLYYYVGDAGPGDVDGEGVDGVWFVIDANGKLVKPAK
jgi:predicted lipoprotein with Yx(FWY)xxD motif